jgi:4-amino-4-deoxy-L-arabinose transferase-like glycosyltransferase
MKLRHARIVPLILFIVALISRVTTAAILLHSHGQALFYQGNEPSYIASHIAAGEGFSSPYENTPIAPTAQQPPLYPALIAAVFWIFGSFSVRSLWTLLAIHSIAGAATAVLIYACGAQYFTRRIGLFAACFWILWPYESLFDAPIAIYGLSALVVSLWFLVSPRILAESNSNRDWVLLGVGGGLALLLNQPSRRLFLLPVCGCGGGKMSHGVC